jgi:hypothetical protein
VTRHRRQSFWQITLPVLVVLLLLGLAFALVVLSGAADISGVADLALVLVSLPLLVIGLIPVAAVFALVVGMAWLLRETPSATRVAQDVSARVSEIIIRAMRAVTNVIIPAVVGYSMAQRILGGDRKDGADGSQPDDPPAQ